MKCLMGIYDESLPYKELDEPVEKNLWNIPQWDDKLEIVYHLEIVNNEKDWEKVCEDGINRQYEPWDYYKKRKYHSLSDAIRTYMILSMAENTYDIRLFMEAIYDENILYEEQLDLGDGFTATLSQAVDEDMRRKLKNLNQTVKEMDEEYNKMKEFTQNSMIKKMWEQFKEQSN